MRDLIRPMARTAITGAIDAGSPATKIQDTGFRAGVTSPVSASSSDAPQTISWIVPSEVSDIGIVSSLSARTMLTGRP